MKNKEGKKWKKKPWIIASLYYLFYNYVLMVSNDGAKIDYFLSQGLLGFCWENIHPSQALTNLLDFWLIFLEGLKDFAN